MKLLFDFLPIILFFITYKAADIYWATGVAIVVSVLQVGGTYIVKRKVDRMPLTSMVLIVLMGGATLMLRDERFIMWKPSLVYWLFAAAFLASQFIGTKNLAQRMMEKALAPPPRIWVIVNYAWVAFFVFIGALNLWVAFTFSENTWVNFRLFGLLSLMIVFFLALAVALRNYIIEPTEEEEPPTAE